MQTDTQTLIEQIENFAGIWHIGFPDYEGQYFVIGWKGNTRTAYFVPNGEYESGWKNDVHKWLDPSPETKAALLSLLQQKKHIEVSEQTDDDIQQEIYNHLNSLPYEGGYPYNWKETLAQHLGAHVRSQLSAELETLRNWKQEAISVMPDYHAIGKAINIPLGHSVHDKILPFIQSLSAKDKEKDELLREFLQVLYLLDSATDVSASGGTEKALEKVSIMIEEAITRYNSFTSPNTIT